MNTPPPPPPPAEEIVTRPCQPDSPICVYIPERITADVPQVPTEDIEVVEVRPEKVGGYEAGDTVYNRVKATDDILFLVWGYIRRDSERGYGQNMEKNIWLDAIRLDEDYQLQRDAIRVAACESAFNPDSISTSGDYGIWQHNKRFIQDRWDRWRKRQGLRPQRISPEDALRPSVNARLTMVLLEQRGWSWSGSSGWACGKKVGAK